MKTGDKVGPFLNMAGTESIDCLDCLSSVAELNFVHNENKGWRFDKYIHHTMCKTNS